MFDRIKRDREIKRIALERINAAIEMARDDDRISAEEVAELIEKKRAIQLNGLNPSDILKVVANVAIVAVIVGFEMSHVMNQKGSRFLKVL